MCGHCFTVCYVQYVLLSVVIQPSWLPNPILLLLINLGYPTRSQRNLTKIAGVDFYRIRICLVKYMLSCGVCPSVRPSVTLLYCIKTTELIINQLALDCSLGTLVYAHHHEYDGESTTSEEPKCTNLQTWSTMPFM